MLERIDAKERKSKVGRKPICRILMFKMLILQRVRRAAASTKSRLACRAYDFEPC